MSEFKACNHFWSHDSNGFGKTCIRCGVLDNDLFQPKPQFTYTILSGAQVGSVLQLTPQVKDIGDDFPIENHISPNCQSRDV
ncbi:hypothetical protein V8P80_14660 [Acinetobacter baumannii]